MKANYSFPYENTSENSFQGERKEHASGRSEGAEDIHAAGQSW